MRLGGERERDDQRGAGELLIDGLLQFPIVEEWMRRRDR
jgi:hypothetical protein